MYIDYIYACHRPLAAELLPFGLRWAVMYHKYLCMTVTIVTVLKTKFKKEYKVPHIIFWNLRTTDGFPNLTETKNTSMIPRR